MEISGSLYPKNFFQRWFTGSGVTYKIEEGEGVKTRSFKIPGFIAGLFTGSNKPIEIAITRVKEVDSMIGYQRNIEHQKNLHAEALSKDRDNASHYLTSTVYGPGGLKDLRKAVIGILDCMRMAEDSLRNGFDQGQAHLVTNRDTIETQKMVRAALYKNPDESRNQKPGAWTISVRDFSPKF